MIKIQMSLNNYGKLLDSYVIYGINSHITEYSIQ